MELTEQQLLEVKKEVERGFWTFTEVAQKVTSEALGYQLGAYHVGHKPCAFREDLMLALDNCKACLFYYDAFDYLRTAEIYDIERAVEEAHVLDICEIARFYLEEECNMLLNEAIASVEILEE